MLCSECGKENRDRNKFCIYCGNRLNNLPEAVFSVVTVRALPSNIWQPKVAQQLMISLFSIYEPINFFVHAKNGSISWYIETFSELVPIIRKVFYSFYQNIYLTSEPKTSAYLDYRLYHYRTQKPFLYSLKVAEDFGNLDPLPTLISSMTGLKNGEEIVYQSECVKNCETT